MEEHSIQRQGCRCGSCGIAATPALPSSDTPGTRRTALRRQGSYRFDGIDEMVQPGIRHGEIDLRWGDKTVTLRTYSPQADQELVLSLVREILAHAFAAEARELQQRILELEMETAGQQVPLSPRRGIAGGGVAMVAGGGQE